MPDQPQLVVSSRGRMEIMKNEILAKTCGKSRVIWIKGG
jgi:hypothetical protein